MCNRYGYLAPVSRLADEFSQIRIPLVFKGGAIPNIAPRKHIRPTDTAPIVRPIDRADPAAGVELIDARWWLIPFFHRKSVKEWKPMCANARAETLATAATFREAFKRRRCLVPDPANPTYPSTAGGHRRTLTDHLRLLDHQNVLFVLGQTNPQRASHP